MLVSYGVLFVLKCGSIGLWEIMTCIVDVTWFVSLSTTALVSYGFLLGGV